MKERASIINRSGIDILYIDFSGLSGDTFLSAIEQVKNFCLQIPGSKLYPSITDMTNASTNSRIREALANMEKELKAHQGGKVNNKPRVVTGITGLQRMVAGAITQGIHYAGSLQEAIDYIKKEESV